MLIARMQARHAKPGGNIAKYSPFRDQQLVAARIGREGV